PAATGQQPAGGLSVMQPSGAGAGELLIGTVRGPRAITTTGSVGAARTTGWRAASRQRLWTLKDGLGSMPRLFLKRGKGSRIRDKMNEEERAVTARER